MLYNIKTLPLHCVFHGIRFKVNEDWVSVIDTLLFFCVFSSFFFCSNKRKTKQKENSPSAFFYLLQHFSPLNKKNSLRSNSFLFLTLHKAPPLHGKKVRPIYNEHCFARYGGCSFMFILNALFVSFCRVKTEENIHLKQQSAFESSDGGPAFSGGA